MGFEERNKEKRLLDRYSIYKNRSRFDINDDHNMTALALSKTIIPLPTLLYNHTYPEIIRILVINHETEENLLFNLVLKDAGIKPDFYEDPILALQQFRCFHYDLVILNIKIPKINSHEVYRELKNIDHNVKICFLTEDEECSQNLENFLPTLNKRKFIKKSIATNEFMKDLRRLLE